MAASNGAPHRSLGSAPSATIDRAAPCERNAAMVAPRQSARRIKGRSTPTGLLSPSAKTPSPETPSGASAASICAGMALDTTAASNG